MKNYSRFVAFDVGTKRIGVAQTDLLKTIASPIGTFHPDEVMEYIQKTAESAPIDKFIVGWPLTPNGDEGPATKMVERFINRLKNAFPDIIVEKVDERYTSNQAVDAMIQAGVPKMKRQEKERVDRIAAAIILQKYLENR